MEIIKHPLATEKSIRLMESENKLIFVVNTETTKPEIKKEIEKLFKVKVDNVNTYRTPKGEKRAYITFNKANPAIDVATELGLL
jgi:large subunit ribosomal protein L23